MILIVSNSVTEAAALSALCHERTWPNFTCLTIEALKRALERNRPTIVLSRHRLHDGYSDDVISLIQTSANPEGTATVKYLVLAPASFSAKQEARQLNLGADCVLRDPLRLEVLLAYLTKFRTKAAAPTAAPGARLSSYPFAGATVFPEDQRLEANGRSLHLTPRELEFIQLLHRSAGHAVSYEHLYAELFGRTFSGDTANSRVLLGRLKQSFRQLGIDLGAVVQVLPKSGYKYVASPIR